VQVDERQEQTHGAALRDFPGFVQVALSTLGAGARAGQAPQPGASEEAANNVFVDASTAEAGHSSVYMGEVRSQKSEVERAW
jgi:hypothetical protein